ncbi:Serotransferrin, partial [Intoshia linei]
MILVSNVEYKFDLYQYGQLMESMQLLTLCMDNVEEKTAEVLKKKRQDSLEHEKTMNELKIKHDKEEKIRIKQEEKEMIENQKKKQKELKILEELNLTKDIIIELDNSIELSTNFEFHLKTLMKKIDADEDNEFNKNILDISNNFINNIKGMFENCKNVRIKEEYNKMLENQSIKSKLSLKKSIKNLAWLTEKYIQVLDSVIDYTECVEILVVTCRQISTSCSKLVYSSRRETDDSIDLMDILKSSSDVMRSVSSVIAECATIEPSNFDQFKDIDKLESDEIKILEIEKKTTISRLQNEIDKENEFIELLEGLENYYSDDEKESNQEASEDDVEELEDEEGEVGQENEGEDLVKICIYDTKSEKECINMAKSMNDVECIKKITIYDCISDVGQQKVDVMKVDAGLVGVVYDEFGLIPIVKEEYKDYDTSSLSVAVIKRKDKNKFQNLNDLRGSVLCSSGIQRLAGWIYPISHMMKEGIMNIIECNQAAKSVGSFFKMSCAVNSLLRIFNPFGNNPASLCKACGSTRSTHCLNDDEYAGESGAIKCLQKSGDVAFLRYGYLHRNSNFKKDYVLLCPTGNHVDMDESTVVKCNFGKTANDVYITSRWNSKEQKKEIIDNILKFGRLIISDRKKLPLLNDSINNNIISTDAVNLKELNEEEKFFQSYVGPVYLQKAAILNSCPIKYVRWCCISKQEMSKCELMIMAFESKSLSPKLNCILGKSVQDCLKMISLGHVDMMKIDAAELFYGALNYGIVPIAYEDYGYANPNYYYGVAVMRKKTSHLSLVNLKNAITCHSSISSYSGWVLPVLHIIGSDQIHPAMCQLHNAVGELLDSACVPGIFDDFFEVDHTPINLGQACSTDSSDHSKATTNENYFGESGAFRCLVENSGEIAFVRHTTILHNIGGNNPAHWARNRRIDDYEILCPGGGRESVYNWKICNLGIVPSNVVVTVGFKTEQERFIYWSLLNYGQQFFSSS